MELLGRAIAPGVACGPVVRIRPDLTPEEATDAILVADRAVPEDVPRILVCAATITGMAPPLSHVALLSRELGKPSVGLPRLDELAEGTIVLVDGTRGVVVIDPDETLRAQVRSVPRPAPRGNSQGRVVRPSDGERLVFPFGPGLRREEAGGKAAALAEVIDALPSRCRIPPGFVVTAAAYRRHLAGEVDEKLRRAQDSRLARAAILAGAVPADVRLAIEEACRNLAGRLAVRSSATIEDGPEGTLAGLFDSSLGVPPHALVDRVRSIWASLWNERAVAYLRAAGSSPAEASQAVLVQEVVATSPSGAFVTNRDVVTLNAVWGLGEAIAQGEAPGDLFRLRASTGELLSSEVAPSTSWIVLDPDRPGTVERPLPPELRGRPSVSADQLATLAALARTLGPDRIVEFGFDASGTLVVFQVRRAVPRWGE